MRIKFREGMTIERITDMLIGIIRTKGMIIGEVDVLISTYDSFMKLEPKSDDKVHYIKCNPTDEHRKEYEADVVRIRRERIRKI